MASRLGGIARFAPTAYFSTEPPSSRLSTQIPMALTVLARSAARQGVRTFRTSAVAKSAGHDYHHLPFAWPGDKKVAFGTKVGVFLAVGFAIPFVASVYQLKKSAGAA
ncbi:hypothetical protein DFP72DRAFT_1060952 [Ephemerocybe angulata]|uniref:Cytochrome c oxidase polypeptide VIIc n=1 Tax=Ephemerocybe angulata TaxID=980116 RepID=A0A8H6IBX8_9AGAR|nr:hypothetical protein DFP72DRAFT_1060952 [Tulosesus angulatus]